MTVDVVVSELGDVTRFKSSKAVCAYAGLVPAVRQSAGKGKDLGITKTGSPLLRWALVEAAWSVVLQPGPLHAFYERVRARRGHGKANVATARKLAILFWCMLTRSEDSAHQRNRRRHQSARRQRQCKEKNSFVQRHRPDPSATTFARLIGPGPSRNSDAP